MQLFFYNALEYLQHLFRQIGFSKIDAQVRAQVAYYVRLGWFMTVPPRKTAERLAQIRLIHQILTQIDIVS